MDYLETALRAWTGTDQRRTPDRTTTREIPPYVLVLDTETTVDAAQRLTFGSYRYYRVHRAWGGRIQLRCVEEGMIHADDLPEIDPEGFTRLQEYAATRTAATIEGVPGEIRLMSRSDFVRIVLYQEAWRKRSLIVGFNLPFDLSRIAVGFGAARGDHFRGGISLQLWDYEDELGQRRENRFRPRIAIKTIDSKRALKGFTRPAEVDPIDQIPEGKEGGRPDKAYIFRGHFLDLRTLVFALTDRGHSLASACEAFGVERGKTQAEAHGEINAAYIDYNRRDVEATAALVVKALEEYQRHPISLQPTRAYSPAGIGKAYLREMGVPPSLDRDPPIPDEVLGYAMSAYYGGRSECRIRKTPVPVVYLDFLSMYPTVNALMGLWRFHIAREVRWEDHTDEVRSLLEKVTLADCFRSETWGRLCVLVEVEARGEVFPVRARYDPASPVWGIGVNHLHAERRWYTLPDVLAARLLSGRTPRVLGAIALVAEGVQEGLQPTSLRGGVAVDPARDDLFRVAIEERKQLDDRAGLSAEERVRLDRFLKVFANATSYGIFAEMVRSEHPRGRKETVRVWGDDGEFEARVSVPEVPGEFAQPFIAACITGGARLMLAMLEAAVTMRGGFHAICDTDSMAIVSAPEGGLVPCPGGPLRSETGGECIRALSWAQVDEIVERFTELNPYDQSTVASSILEVEEENFDPQTGAREQLWCYSISAKRYALYNLTPGEEPVLRKWSEHGLGHLLNPVDPDDEDRDWIRQTWEWIVRRDLGLNAAEPFWLDRPAMTRITASSPHVLRAFSGYNAGKRYADQVKPFNFLLSAQVAPFGHPEGVDPTRFHLVAPWSPDPGEWLKLPWFDLHSGREFRVTTTDDYGASPSVLVKTYRDVLGAYERHPEAKSRGAA